MGLWLDVGLGHYDENIRIKGLDRDALDVNLHWLTTSHIELIATTRIELINQARTRAARISAGRPVATRCSRRTTGCDQRVSLTLTRSEAVLL